MLGSNWEKLRDKIVGVDSELTFFFTNDKLKGVMVEPWDEWTSEPYDTRHARTDLEGSFYDWYNSLSKRYGTGALFDGDERMGVKADFKSLQTKLSLVFSDDRSFHVGFTPSERTVVELHAGYVKESRLKGHHVSILFTEIVADNF